MHVSTLPPAESFADVLAWDDAPATGLTDADLRAAWVRARLAGISRATLLSMLRAEIASCPDFAEHLRRLTEIEDDDAQADQVH